MSAPDVVVVGAGIIGAACAYELAGAGASDCAQANELAVYDVATRKEIKRIPVGAVPVGILIEPDGDQAWVACTAADTVVRFDLKTLEAAGQVSAGRQPDGLALVVR